MNFKTLFSLRTSRALPTSESAHSDPTYQLYQVSRFNLFSFSFADVFFHTSIYRLIRSGIYLRRIFFLACLTLFLPTAYAQEKVLTEIVVTAELLENNALQLPNSATVFDAESVAARSAHHLEDLLNLTPNVNFATGASRGKFIQIRGIGERSEFQEPIINSVGLIADGIDFTGLAGAAATLDIAQVEVLRGPQGTLHGANALAGLINVVSAAPTAEPYYQAGVSVEDYGGLEVNGVASGPLGESTAYRLALKQYNSDGFTQDIHLQRDDTNKLDETTVRLRIDHQASDALALGFTLFGADIDNGYDAFSLDNTRQTYSDEPGVDQQETIAAALAVDYQINEQLSFDGTLSIADSDLRYAYDEDWSHTGICRGTVCDSDLFGFDWFYSSFDDYRRSNNNTSIDLRLINTNEQSWSWVLGFYHRDQNIDLERQYTFAEADFFSDLETSNTALYGQADIAINDRWSLSLGLRFENRDQEYADSTGAVADPDESLWGGRVALSYLSSTDVFYYGLISRGYKPGGFNLDESIAADQREFSTETMVNYELGVKRSFFDQQLSLQIAAFYQDRDDIQSKQSIVRSIATGELGGLCPCSFTDLTANATSGRNQGVELELNWAANSQLNLFAAVGILETSFDQFLTFEHVNADRENGVPFDLRGREQAHAPGYQAVIGGSFEFADNWRLSGSIEAKDDFYFSDRHEERSDAYELFNLQIAYIADNWQVALYGKNLTDELVKTRGFGSFGNDPRKFYATEPYNQFAAPRVIGVKGSIEF